MTATLIAALTPQASAQTAAPTEIPIGLPDTRRIESFANGDIRHSPVADIYFLVVQASDKTGQFWLQCERRGPFTVDLDKGVDALTAAIEREPVKAHVPGWPWTPVARLLRVLPLSVVRRLT